MKTVCISMGNSDYKLSRAEWNRFFGEVQEIIEAHCHQIHFFGSSSTWEQWQSLCWWIDIRDEQVSSLKHSLDLVRRRFDQDSIAWLEGHTEFIGV